MLPEYDIIVVGAGHAGCEAAAAAAKLGSRVLLITANLENMAQMSCNPAMGGIAKGQIVREIDALGGQSGIVSDISAIQFRMLNRSKGPAMWSPRTQNDRGLFSRTWRQILEGITALEFWQDTVTGLVFNNNRVSGVTTALGITIRSRAVILTNGTFLNGIIHIGEKKFSGGRVGEKSVTGLTEQLQMAGLLSGRMKTGTPPRLDARSIDYTCLTEQPGDEVPGQFSFSGLTNPLDCQRSCHIAFTSPVVHDILRSGFDRSPMFNGAIKSTGPRYCPSIEDKISRFADRERHQLFIEPEGWDTVEIYLNGFSTSLPEEVQLKALRHINGFKNVKMFRPGYAIEYDFFPPVQVSHTLESKVIECLYMAGQVNGTTGYEEAACQGLMAGINAHRKLCNETPFILNRSEAYIGVLIDDLVTKGTEEPYRMFTSRAEFRILLRQDNADIRLTELGYEIGLASMDRLKRVEEKIAGTRKLVKYLQQESITPEIINPVIEASGSETIRQKVKMQSLVARPQLGIENLIKVSDDLDRFIRDFGLQAKEILEQAEIEIKYRGYLEKEKEMAEKHKKLEDLLIHDNFDYTQVRSLSLESRQKLLAVRPRTIGQASRISGVSPSDISILLIYLGR